MKAVVLDDFRKLAVIEEVTRPKPGADDELRLAQAKDALEELRRGSIRSAAALSSPPLSRVVPDRDFLVESPDGAFRAQHEVMSTNN